MKAILTAAAPGGSPETVAALLLPWWDANRRDLPWRAAAGQTPDPYRVWLSEILLQQTTTAGAAPYFRQFVSLWPDVTSLAAAPLEVVMQAFAGLGYYSRARNLHACAKAVAAMGGKFPDAESELRELPGVGAYTAAAVAAIAFDRPTAPVDGNIARIVSRLARFERPIAANRGDIAAYARSMTAKSRSGDFAQALMDLGATVCRPRNPLCDQCPLRAVCLGFGSGRPEDFPARPPRKLKRIRVGAAFYATRPDGAFLARRRPPKGLLGSTMELPGGDWVAGEIATLEPDDAPFAADWERKPGHLEHVFTHFTLRLAIFAAHVDRERPPDGMVWIGHDETDAGFSGLMRKAIDFARGGAPR